AEMIAGALPVHAQASSWRGYGVVRLRLGNEQAARELIPLVKSCVEQHELAWARVRIGDDETMLRRNGRKAASRPCQRRPPAQACWGSRGRSTFAAAYASSSSSVSFSSKASAMASSRARSSVSNVTTLS